MKTGFWVKLVLGLVSIVLLIIVGSYLLESMINAFTNLMSGEIPDDGSGDYAIETPEPMPTMPAYMQEDSFYDNAGSVGDE